VCNRLFRYFSSRRSSYMIMHGIEDFVKCATAVCGEIILLCP
jgi:hypothetical protein